MNQLTSKELEDTLLQSVERHGAVEITAEFNHQDGELYECNSAAVLSAQKLIREGLLSGQIEAGVTDSDELKCFWTTVRLWQSGRMPGEFPTARKISSLEREKVLLG